MKFKIFFMFCLVFSTTTHAKNWADCAVVENDKQRLGCFDAAAKEAGLTKALSAKGELGAWQVKNSVDPMTDKGIFIAALPSKTLSKRGLKRSMIVRCQDGTTEVFVDFREYFSKYAAVTARFDSNEPIEENWSLSTDNVAAFHREPLPFAKKLLTARKLVLRTQPYNESPVTLEFDLSGASTALQHVRKNCNW